MRLEFDPDDLPHLVRGLGLPGNRFLAVAFAIVVDEMRLCLAQQADELLTSKSRWGSRIENVYSILV